jgi:hypothetical protein
MQLEVGSWPHALNIAFRNGNGATATSTDVAAKNMPIFSNHNYLEFKGFYGSIYRLNDSA